MLEIAEQVHNKSMHTNTTSKWESLKKNVLHENRHVHFGYYSFAKAKPGWSIEYYIFTWRDTSNNRQQNIPDHTIQTNTDHV